MEILTGGPPLPCQPQFVRDIQVTRASAGNGRVKVTREVWFIDRTGNTDWAIHDWTERAAA